MKVIIKKIKSPRVPATTFISIEDAMIMIINASCSKWVLSDRKAMDKRRKAIRAFLEGRGTDSCYGWVVVKRLEDPVPTSAPEPVRAVSISKGRVVRYDTVPTYIPHGDCNRPDLEITVAKDAPSDALEKVLDLIMRTTVAHEADLIILTGIFWNKVAADYLGRCGYPILRVPVSRFGMDKYLDSPKGVIVSVGRNLLLGGGHEFPKKRYLIVDLTGSPPHQMSSVMLKSRVRGAFSDYVRLIHINMTTFPKPKGYIPSVTEVE